MNSLIFLSLLYLDISAIAIRVVTGRWSKQAKLSLLFSHLVLWIEVMDSFKEQRLQQYPNGLDNSVGTTVVVVNHGLNLYQLVADMFKSKPDQSSCTLILATEHDDERCSDFAYHATITGTDCDTTPGREAIFAHVKECADDLDELGACSGCCILDGGTWTGHLRLTADPESWSAGTVDC